MTLKFDGLSPWLENLPFSWESFQEQGQEKLFEKEEYIYQQGDSLQFVYIVLSGRIRLYLSNADGKEKTVTVVGKNGLLGEEFLTAHENHITSAIAVSPSNLLRVEMQTFKEIALADKNLSRQWLEILSMKIQLLTRSSLVLSYDNSLKNISSTFLELGKVYGELQQDHSVKITITFTHQELAELVGVTRVTVSNIIKQLCEKGLIRKEKKYYHLVKVKELEHLL